MSLKDEGVDATTFLCSSGDTKSGMVAMMSVDADDMLNDLVEIRIIFGSSMIS